MKAHFQWPGRSLQGKRNFSCCYLPETWAVIFGWVELSAPRSTLLSSRGKAGTITRAIATGSLFCLEVESGSCCSRIKSSCSCSACSSTRNSCSSSSRRRPRPGDCEGIVIIVVIISIIVVIVAVAAIAGVLPSAYFQFVLSGRNNRSSKVHY